jgi:integrase
MKYPKHAYERDPEVLHLYVKDIRILTPKEYDTLKTAILKEAHKTILDILLITGMRYVEVLRLYDHKEWYNEKGNLIHLPESVQKKQKRRQVERTIYPLPSMFSYLLQDFWQANRPPLETTWNKNLQRWAATAGINPYGLSVKTTRKTLESWMIAAGITESAVCLRQGHDSLTSMKHYQELVFSEDELKDIMKKLTSWGITK